MLRAVVPGPACRGGLLPKGPDLARQRISSRLKARDNQGIWLVGWLSGVWVGRLASENSQSKTQVRKTKRPAFRSAKRVKIVIVQRLQPSLCENETTNHEHVWYPYETPFGALPLVGGYSFL